MRRLSGLILTVVLTSLCVTQLGLTMTSAVIAACLATASCCLLLGLGGFRTKEEGPVLVGLLLLLTSTSSRLGLGLSDLLIASLLCGLLFATLAARPIRERLLSGIPSSVRIGLLASLGILAFRCALRLSGILSEDSSGAVCFAGVFDPAFVCALVSVLATVILKVSDVPSSGLLGILIATAAGIPLGLTRLPAGLVSAPDLSLTQSSASGIISGLGHFADRLPTPDFLGTFVALSLALLLTSECPRLLGGFGLAVSSAFGIPGLLADGEPHSGGRRAALGEALALVVVLIVLSFLSPLVSCVPVSATCGPLLLACLGPVASLAECDLRDASVAVPMAGMIVSALATGSLAWALSAGVLLDAGIGLGSGRHGSFNPVSICLCVLSVVFVLLSTGL